jgi:hypothetical protein
MKIAIYQIEHETPAGDHHAIPVKGGRAGVFLVDQDHDLLVFDPAAEMNNAEEDEEAPRVPEEPRQHDHYEYGGRQATGFEYGGI